MRFNSLAQIAKNDEGRAVCPWLNDTTVGPYQRNIGGDTWQMVTRDYASSVVTPVPNIVGGCNESAACNDRWMRYLAGSPLAGSQTWLPANGFVGDVSRDFAATISADGLGVTTWYKGAQGLTAYRQTPFGGVRIKGNLMAWLEFPGPAIKAYDLIFNAPVTVQTLQVPVYTPLVFQSGTVIWVLYQCDALGGVCHRINDPSQGYLFGTPESIYDPDVLVDGQSCRIGWSTDAGQFNQAQTFIPALGQGMVPLVLPAPDPPIGPVGPPLPDGTLIDVRQYFTYNSACHPRGIPALGDTHAMDMQPLGAFDANGKLFSQIAFVKFGPEFKGERYELMQWKDGFLHHLEDASNPILDTWEGDTRWISETLKVGYQHRFISAGHRLVTKQRGTCGAIKAIDWKREVWIVNAWDKFYCGKELGIRPVIRVANDNTGGVHGPDRLIETYYYVLDAGWAEWTADQSSVVFADPNNPTFPAVPRERSRFWRVGGPRTPVQLSGCAPKPSIPGSIMPVPNLSQVIKDLYNTGSFKLDTKEGCGIFTRAAVRACRAVDPRFGDLLKKPGQNQYDGHAVDNMLYLSDTPGQSVAVDIISQSETPQAAPSWGEDIPRYSRSDWNDPGPYPQSTVNRPALPFLAGMSAFDWLTHRDERWLDLHVQYGLPVLRVVPQSVFRTPRTLAEGIAQLRQGLVVLKARGLKALVVVNCDTHEYGMTADDVVNNTKAINAVMVEQIGAVAAATLCNENQNGNEQPFMMDPDFLLTLDALIDPRIPLAPGTLFGPNPSVQMVGGSYIAHHADRGLTPAANGVIMGNAQTQYGKKVVDEEPLGAAEPGTPGQRYFDPAYALALGTAARTNQLGGAIFHSQAGLTARVSEFGPTHKACAQAFKQGLGNDVPPPQPGPSHPILDAPLAPGIPVGYRFWIVHWKDLEFEADAWYRRAHGHAPDPIKDIGHGLWRAIYECDKFKTARAAWEDTWPGGAPTG